ncbi:MAG: TniB family NTP-binding protein [Ktedonobacteraceae bacterium]
MRDVYEEELRRLRLRAVLLDEAQYLIASGDNKQPKDQLNWIKSMSTETGVLHALIGTYDLLPFCNLDGQMARRGSEFHIARYHMENENDCQVFRIEIKWEQCYRREKPPIVHSHDQSNWRQLVGWNRKSKKCDAQRAVR